MDHRNRRRDAGSGIDHIAHTRSIEEPHLRPTKTFTGVGEEPPLKVLHPRPELLDHETCLLEAAYVRVQVLGRRRLEKNVGAPGRSPCRRSETV